MIAFHVVLGVMVLVLSLIAGVRTFIRGGDEWSAGVAAVAHLALGLQVAAGFLLFTSGGPGPAHALVPAAALGAVVVVRVSRGEAHPRDVLAVSWAVAAAATFGLATGLSS